MNRSAGLLPGESWLRLIFLLVAAWLSLHPASVIPAESDFPRASSKKGLQVQMVEDAIQLGVKHAALNVDLTSLIDPSTNGSAILATHEGQTFRFNRSAVESLDRQIKPLSERGVLVYLILLAYASGDTARNRLMLHPGYDPAAPNKLGAFNTATGEGRAWLSACARFLSARWSGSAMANGRVCGYILGNEVNSHWWWSNMGRVSMLTFADAYADAARLVHAALREHSSWARLYLSLEHHWGIRYPAGDERQSFPGREFLEYFADKVRSGGDFDWHLAFHPYPENLFEPRFWNDQSATVDDRTARITFKNLEVLERLMRQPRFLFAGKPRRVILSEQGFHTPKGVEGERIQAAAYCLAYKKAEVMDGIDAFILHRHVDHAGEGGLLLGLWTHKPGSVCEPAARKIIYECFQRADQPDWEKTFKFALPIVGLKEWPARELRP